MKQLILILFTLILGACAQPKSPQLLGGSKAPIGPDQKWVWYAPTFSDGSLPNDIQMGYYFSKLAEQNIHVVGVDVGESYGSPIGQATFDSYYTWMQQQGYAKKGCMLLQSRGGLQGYSWALNNQDKVSCVAGIYPLVDLRDYKGVSVYAPIWGVTAEWMLDNLATINPLHRANEFNFPILHVHGDQDAATSFSIDQAFIGAAPNAELIEVIGQGHEWYSNEFFQNDTLINFLLAHTGS